jgi:hypothetical protein
MQKVNANVLDFRKQCEYGQNNKIKPLQIGTETTTNIIFTHL